MSTPGPEDPFRAPSPAPSPAPPPASRPDWSGGGYGPPPSAWQGPGPVGRSGAPQTESKAIIALVCAIGSFLVLPLVLAVAALVVAGNAQRDIEASGGWLTGDGLVTAAKVIAWANLVLCAIAAVLIVLAVFLFAGAAVLSV